VARAATLWNGRLLSWQYGGEPFYFYRRQGPKFVSAKQNSDFPITRFVGLEIEGSGFGDGATKADLQNLQKVVKKWNGDIVQDVDYEIRTSPARGEAFIKQTLEVCLALSNAKSECDSHCGGHIHIDMRDFKKDDIRNLLLIVSRVEKVMIRTQPKGRIVGGPWCRPVAGKIPRKTLLPYEKEKTWSPAVRAVQTGGNEMTWTPWNSAIADRYNAVNFLAYREHKTVEIRMAKGTHDPTEIIPWASSWCDIVTAAKRMGVKAAADFPNTLDKLAEVVNTKAMDYLKQRTEEYAGGWTR